MTYYPDIFKYRQDIIRNKPDLYRNYKNLSLWIDPVVEIWRRGARVALNVPNFGIEA